MSFDTWVSVGALLGVGMTVVSVLVQGLKSMRAEMAGMEQRLTRQQAASEERLTRRQTSSEERLTRQQAASEERYADRLDHVRAELRSESVASEERQGRRIDAVAAKIAHLTEVTDVRLRSVEEDMHLVKQRLLGDPPAA